MESPIDETPVVVNGVPLDRTSIEPIVPSDEVIEAIPAKRVGRRIPISPHSTVRAIPPKQTIPQLPVIEHVYPQHAYIVNDKVTETEEIPDYSNMDQISQWKARALFRNKFQNFKNTFPEIKVPDWIFSDQVPLERVHIEWDSHQEFVAVGTHASTYKQYLTCFWFGLEVVLVWLGIDAKGFTQHQIRSMTKYESYLMVLGEKQIKTGQSGFFGSEAWSPEVTLIFLTAISSIVFVGIKLLAPKFGFNTDDASKLVHQFEGMFTGQETSNPITNSIPSEGVFSGIVNMISQNPNSATTVGEALRNGTPLINTQQTAQPQQQQEFKPQYDE
jgi:hypothetical protein